MFPLSLRRDLNAKRKTNTRRTGEVIYSYIDSYIIQYKILLNI